MTEPIPITINLDAAGVQAPAQTIAIETARAVGTLLRALSRDDLSPLTDAEGTGGIRYRFEGLNRDPEEWRAVITAWLITKAFQDLARGVRETLEAAHFYVTLARQPGPQRTTWGELQKLFGEMRNRANRLTFPDLLDQVNRALQSPLSFAAEFLSLQKARNCLEHRAGIVSDKDIEPGEDALVLTFPRMKMFYMRGGEEIELRPGEVIDTQDPTVARNDGEGVPILGRLDRRSVRYQLGERVVIQPQDFHEIAMACHFFADDLASKLPTIKGSPATKTQWP